MFSKHRHVDDNQLLDAYFSEADRGVLAAGSALATCAICRDRYGRLVQALAASRRDAAAEAAAIFTPERLAHQRDHIFRRLEIASHPPRVLRFPATARIVASGERHGRRWIAAAAAAGLLIGVLVGQIMDLHSRLDAPRTALRAAPARVQTPAVSAITADESWAPPEPDEAFLVEIDAALVAPRTPELQALDHFTPRVTEIAFAGR